MVEVVTLPSAALDGTGLRDLRRLLDAAFGPRFNDSAWAHALGGTHYVICQEGCFVAHAAVIERRLSVGGEACTGGYVEAVATDPQHGGRGYGSAIMERVAEGIRETVDLGALATGIGDFYTRLGWERWQGPTFVESPEGRTRTADDDGWVYVLRTPSTASADITDSLTCDWRSGRVW
jgi:aminoglycoside 2'-N-acetyltransferase I